MSGTEDNEGLKHNNESLGYTQAKGCGCPLPGSPAETSRPMATLPNIFFSAYAAFVIFSIIRNVVAAQRPESLGTVIGYMAMLFIPFAAVAVYNLARSNEKLIGKASVGITAFFLIFSMVVELESASKNRQRLAEAQGMVNALSAQRGAVPNDVPDAFPPSVVTNKGKLAVPLKGSISVKMDSEPMKTVELVDPAIAHVSTVSPYELQVMGLKKGTTSLSIKDRGGYRFAYEVNVE